MNVRIPLLAALALASAGCYDDIFGFDPLVDVTVTGRITQVGRPPDSASIQLSTPTQCGFLFCGGPVVSARTDAQGRYQLTGEISAGLCNRLEVSVSAPSDFTTLPVGGCGSRVVDHDFPGPVVFLGVVIRPERATIAVGATQPFVGTLLDVAGNTVGNRTLTWSSSDVAIVRIDAVTGVATGVALGSATIKVTTPEGIPGAAPVTVVAVAPPVPPAPLLVFRSTTTDAVSGMSAHGLSVTNWQSYPSEMFAAAPTLPPCGTNTQAARTWVEIREASGEYIYGFCGLRSAVELTRIGFAWPQGQRPSVYVKLIDRLNNTVYTSNRVQIP